MNEDRERTLLAERPVTLFALAHEALGALLHANVSNKRDAFVSRAYRDRGDFDLEDGAIGSAKETLESSLPFSWTRATLFSIRSPGSLASKSPIFIRGSPCGTARASVRTIR